MIMASLTYSNQSIHIIFICWWIFVSKLNSILRRIECNIFYKSDCRIKKSRVIAFKQPMSTMYASNVWILIDRIGFAEILEKVFQSYFADLQCTRQMKRKKKKKTNEKKKPRTPLNSRGKNLFCSIRDSILQWM